MKNNSIITTRYMNTFKRIITDRIECFCGDMNPAEISELLGMLHKDVDNFCLSCLLIGADNEGKKTFNSEGIYNE